MDEKIVKDSQGLAKDLANDCISRKAALDALEKSKEIYFDRQVIIGAMKGIVRNLPSVQLKSYREGYQAGFKDAQSERKRGKWINGTCNQCGSHAPYWAMATTYYRSNFCPNCGADMRGEQDG